MHPRIGRRSTYLWRLWYSTPSLEVFLCEGELDGRGSRRVARITNCLGQNVGL